MSNFTFSMNGNVINPFHDPEQAQITFSIHDNPNDPFDNTEQDPSMFSLDGDVYNPFTDTGRDLQQVSENTGEILGDEDAIWESEDEGSRDESYISPIDSSVLVGAEETSALSNARSINKDDAFQHEFDGASASQQTNYAASSEIEENLRPEVGPQPAVRIISRPRKALKLASDTAASASSSTAPSTQQPLSQSGNPDTSSQSLDKGKGKEVFLDLPADQQPRTAEECRLLVERFREEIVAQSRKECRDEMEMEMQSNLDAKLAAGEATWAGEREGLKREGREWVEKWNQLRLEKEEEVKQLRAELASQQEKAMHACARAVETKRQELRRLHRKEVESLQAEFLQRQHFPSVEDEMYALTTRMSMLSLQPETDGKLQELLADNDQLRQVLARRKAANQSLQHSLAKCRAKLQNQLPKAKKHARELREKAAQESEAKEKVIAGLRKEVEGCRADLERRPKASQAAKPTIRSLPDPPKQHRQNNWTFLVLRDALDAVDKLAEERENWRAEKKSLYSSLSRARATFEAAERGVEESLRARGVAEAEAHSLRVANQELRAEKERQSTPTIAKFKIALTGRIAAMCPRGICR